MAEINYTAPPTCARFMRSNAFGRIIAGPVGSGKTTSCLFELFRRSCEQAPAPDGLRYTRYAVVRQTLKQLKDTVLKDITSWLQNIADYKVSDNTVYISAGDIRSEWILIPLEDMVDQRRLLSMQLSGAWMSEAIEMDCDLIPAISGRCGRYPSANQGGASWHGVIADTNLPSEGSDWWKFMTEPPADWQVFTQPSGMSDQAENLEWLTQTPETLKLPVDHPVRRAQGRKYYERFIANYGDDSDWCRRYVHAMFGDDPSGTAVHRTTFKPDWHVVENLKPVPGHPLIIGQDFGRDPCSIICQLDHKGRLLVLAEVLAEDIGLELHVQQSLRPALMQEQFLGRPVFIAGDPAGRAKSTLYEETSFDVLKRLGFRAFPAGISNDIDRRHRAVDSYLLAARDGGPAILFDKDRCPMLIRALAGGYRYAKNSQGVRKPKPEKNEYSHIADALQYACLASHGGMVTMVSANSARRSTGPAISPAGWT